MKRVSSAVLGAAVLVFWTTTLASGQPASAPASAPSMDPRADVQLKKMTAFLAQFPNLTFSVQVTQQTILPGKNEEESLAWNVFIQRPNRLAIVVASSKTAGLNAYYDGRFLSFYSSAEKNYLTEKAEGPLDEVVNKYLFIFKNYPFMDLVKNDIYQGLIEGIISGELGDRAKITDQDAQELRFGQKQVSWSVWIAAGDKPWPLKITAVVSNPNGPGKKLLTIGFSNWTAPADLPKDTFNFVPPPDATKVVLKPPASQPAAKPN